MYARDILSGDVLTSEGGARMLVENLQNHSTGWGLRKATCTVYGFLYDRRKRKWQTRRTSIVFPALQEVVIEDA